MKVDGFHHVTAITADIDTNLEFYGRLLGLRLVWQGVNADDPEMWHIAYGDERGRPGSLVTFFDMPGVTRGRSGPGMVHRLHFRVAGEPALDFWERRLAGAGVPSDRRTDRLAFSDPEGLRLELVIDDPQDERLVAHARPMSVGKSRFAASTRCARIAPTRRGAHRCSLRCSAWRPRVASAGWRGASAATA
jgi:glyoxalase family protein